MRIDSRIHADRLILRESPKGSRIEPPFWGIVFGALKNSESQV